MFQCRMRGFRVLQVKSVQRAGWEAAALAGQGQQSLLAVVLHAQSKHRVFTCSEFSYIRVALAHGLPQVGVDAAGVGVLNFCLGSHFWGGNVLHTHVHKAWNRNTW